MGIKEGPKGKEGGGKDTVGVKCCLSRRCDGTAFTLRLWAVLSGT